MLARENQVAQPIQVRVRGVGLKGIEMGESQVVREWVAEAEMEKTRALVIRAIQRRFGPPPADVLDAVKAQPSLSLLETWFDAAVSSGSLEEFVAVLQR